MNNAEHNLLDVRPQ